MLIDNGYVTPVQGLINNLRAEVTQLRVHLARVREDLTTESAYALELQAEILELRASYES